MSKLWKTSQSLVFSSWDNKRQRTRWVKSDSQTRKPKQNKMNLKISNRICSLHFVDWIPTKANPLPTMHMGYHTKNQKIWRLFCKHPLPARKTQAEEGEMDIGIINNETNQFESTTKLSSSLVLDNHSDCWQKDTPKRLACVDLRDLIEVLVNQINELTLENKLLKRKTLCYAKSNRSCFTWRKGWITHRFLYATTNFKTYEQWKISLTQQIHSFQLKNPLRENVMCLLVC